MNNVSTGVASVARRLLRPICGWHQREAIRKFFGGKQDMCWVREVSDEASRELVRALPYREFKTLEISGRTWREWEFKSYRSVEYPEYDICAEPLADTFDLIIAEQVFEHLLWPYRAGRNVYQMLKPGGCFLVSTPFLIAIHEHPTDCTRWTESGLKHFLAECGFPLDGVQTGSWGNRRCVKANLNTFLYYRANWHSLKNERLYPVSVWALARKSGS